MTQVIEGFMTSASGHFAVVVSRFNDLVTKRLLEGTVDTLRRHGVAEDRITAVWVPGAFEIPLVADRLAASKKYAAVICLGAVIQGSTSHHEYINSQVASGLMQVGLKHGLPVTFGVLTCESLEQALERAGGKAGNKGVEAALAALETVNVLEKIADVST